MDEQRFTPREQRQPLGRPMPFVPRWTAVLLVLFLGLLRACPAQAQADIRDFHKKPILVAETGGHHAACPRFGLARRRYASFRRRGQGREGLGSA